MRSIVTTALEAVGGVALVAGVFVLFGLGWALLALAGAAFAASWLVTR